MGNHDLGRRIGAAVQVAYERRLPYEPALSILDRFCKGRGGDAEWEAEDPKRPGFQHPEIGHYTDPDPAAGLGMLMVEAFAPNGLKDLSKYHGVLGYTPTGNTKADVKLVAAAEQSADLWHKEVYAPFKKRYKFW
jgi:hypothetical protein